VARASFPDIPATGQFDLILANLYFTFFEKHIEQLGNISAAGSTVFISGLREEESDTAYKMIDRAGLQLSSVDSQGGWIMLEAVRS
jgi:ribosomal protein L11 methylase PrmA